MRRVKRRNTEKGVNWYGIRRLNFEKRKSDLIKIGVIGGWKVQ